MAGASAAAATPPPPAPAHIPAPPPLLPLGLVLALALAQGCLAPSLAAQGACLARPLHPQQGQGYPRGRSNPLLGCWALWSSSWAAAAVTGRKRSRRGRSARAWARGSLAWPALGCCLGMGWVETRPALALPLPLPLPPHPYQHRQLQLTGDQRGEPPCHSSPSFLLMLLLIPWALAVSGATHSPPGAQARGGCLRKRLARTGQWRCGGSRRCACPQTRRGPPSVMSPAAAGSP